MFVYHALIMSGNTLMKCSFIDICVIILFQKKSNFPVTKTSTWPFLPYQEIEKSPCEEHFEESYFSKSVDIGRRLMNSKDKFMSNLAFDL